MKDYKHKLLQIEEYFEKQINKLTKDIHPVTQRSQICMNKVESIEQLVRRANNDMKVRDENLKILEK